ncbi:perlucin-like [Sabethes cyaneus]|uniref:perlucin-like n=1 Tax=Sabethes cyaneus TaxID=53552 RepID=UPI00237D784E|nr:perlucin-like [Sabethes cyaneus]
MYRSLLFLALVTRLVQFCLSQDSELIPGPAEVASEVNSNIDPKSDLSPDEFLRRGKQYFIHCSEKVGFFSAWRSCNDLGLELAAVVSEKDNQLLAEKAAHVHQELWLSGTNLGRRGDWIWLVSRRQVGWGNDYLKWAPGQPQGADKCMLVSVNSQGGIWKAADCHEHHCFVCQKYLT